MKKKIYVCPKCGRALNFSDNPEYTFQCLNCDEDFYMFEAKEVEQPRMEGIKDFTDLAETSMKIKEITERAIQESNRQIEIKNKEIVGQICEYISETIKPIFDSGIYKEYKFKDCARIYSNHLSIKFGDFGVNGGCQAQLWGQDGTLCVYFRHDGKYFIEDRGNGALRWIVEEWPKLKDSMNRMIHYAIEECNKENQKKVEKQKEMAEVINSFRL